MSRLHRLVYTSVPTPDVDDRQIAAILHSARTHNREDGITGFLAFNARTFLQVLEGPGRAISHCLVRLMRDERHDGVELLSYEPIDARAFPDWGMGYAALHSRHESLVARYCGGGEISAQAMSPAGALMLLQELSAEVMMAQSLPPNAVPLAAAQRPAALSASSIRSPAA